MSCETWPIIWPKNVVPDLDQALLDAAIAAAESLIWSRTGRRLGVCTVTEEYWTSGDGCCFPVPGRRGYPTMRGSLTRGLRLHWQPVQEVTQLKLAGAVVASSQYRLAQGAVYLTDGSWPSSTAAAPGIEVAYSWGIPVNGTGIEMAVALAMGEAAFEYLQPSLGGQCRLPSNVSSITRQNVTVNFTAAADIPKGLTGLPLVDALINTVNPNRLMERSKVFIPEMPIVARSGS